MVFIYYCQWGILTEIHTFFCYPTSWMTHMMASHLIPLIPTSSTYTCASFLMLVPHYYTTLTFTSANSVQGGMYNWRRICIHLFHCIDRFPRTNNTADSYQQDPNFLKKLWNFNSTCTKRKHVLGWILNALYLIYSSLYVFVKSAN